MYFPSKKDIWMSSIHFFAAFILIVLPARSENFSILLIITLIIPGLISLFVWLRTGYKIINEKIIIIYGPMKFKVNIHDIQRLHYIKSPFVGPALSVDRIGLTHSKSKFVTISPKDKERFIKELLKINSNIVIDK
ncbi:MAG: PH domain-containing protein [Bacillota bacterium]